MSRSPLALAVLGLVAGLLAPGAAQLVEPAAAAAPTCNGQRATKVGSPGQQTLSGTRGRDVMVTNGSARVYGGPGNDLICVTRRTAVTRVFDGPGNDVVEGRGAAGPISVDLDVGNDVVRGTRFGDRIQPQIHGGAYAGGSDTVYGGAGDDWVSMTNETGRSRVQLGPGSDRLLLGVGHPDRGVTEAWGGDGVDVLQLSGLADTYDLDVPDGDLRRSGRRVMGIEEFEHYDLSSLGAVQGWGPSRVRFSGSAADEVVDMGDAYTSSLDDDDGFDVPVDRTVEIYLGAGDDELRFRGNDSGPARGGLGADQLTVDGTPALSGDGDLAAERFVVTDRGDPTYRAAFQPSLWETVLLEPFDAVTLAGDDGPNVLGVRSDIYRDYAAVRFEGRGGDDVLLGGSRNDTLVGGEGADRADGGGGVDDCDAETVANCEGVDR